MKKNEIFSAIKEAAAITGIDCHPLVTSNRFQFTLVAGRDYILISYRQVVAVRHCAAYVAISLSNDRFVKIMHKFNVICI